LNSRDKISLKGKFYLYYDKLRYGCRIQKENKFYSIIIPEQYKKFIKTIKFILTVIGLLSAYLVFGSVHIAFLFGLLLFIVGWFFERFLFLYVALYIHPLPNFKLHPEKWIGNAFGYMAHQDMGSDIPLVGAIFNDVEYAKNIQALLLSWTNGEYVDKEKNVLLSVISDKSNYYFFIYPSFRQSYSKKKLKEFKKEIRNIDKNGIAEFQYLTFILGRRFDITDKSYFPIFRKIYKNDLPYVYRHYYGKDISNVDAIEGFRDFVFFNLKIKERKNLTRRDLECGVLKMLG